MHIRKIQERDLEDLAKLYKALSDDRCDMEEMRRKFQLIDGNEAYHLLGVEVGGKIVGTLMAITCHDLVGSFKAFMTIENVAVSESCRGMGIGKALFGEAERIAKEYECSYIYLVSGPTRLTAHKMYAKLGYTDEGALGFRKHL